ncbi:hypothetical protein AOQ73_18285 [Bradyrhizobium pachyrhizi]|uniref:hypothetical protein n=1 Tax=Bradyrhizobium pachyrhizi TaxID=280333 RepID=UPI000704BD69|nr:hypothetical protein [Bradyrhizobium pachyrhizi]KRQ01302.1 hypothetical protein AOQ73_18285 [Bradyrhizobium pachyrhizi]
MKASLSKLVPELQRSRMHALENLAATHLRSDKIKMALHNAAKNGHRALRIALPSGIDLTKTDGAESFREWAKENGLVVEWQSRVATTEDGRQATGFDVEISW